MTTQIISKGGPAGPTGPAGPAAKGASPKYYVYLDPGDSLIHAVNNRTGATDHTGSTTSAVVTALLTDLGSTAATISFSDDTHVFAANITIPTNVGIKAVKGTLLSQNTGVTLTLNSTPDAGPYQIFSGAGTVTLGSGAVVGGVYAAWFPSFAAALAAMPATGGDLYVSAAQALAAGSTVPSAVRLVIRNGGQVQPASGQIATVSGTIEAGLYQIFGGAGSVQTGVKIPVLYPEWFGGGPAVADNGPVFTKMIAAAPAAGARFKLSGNYPFLTGVTTSARRNLTFEGNGADNTQLIVNADGVQVFNFTGQSDHIRLYDFWIGSFAARASGGGIAITGLSGGHSSKFDVERVILQNIPNPMALLYVDDNRFRNVKIQQTITGAVLLPWTMAYTISTRVDDLSVGATVGTFPGDAVVVDHDCDTVYFTGAEIGQAGAAGIHLLMSSGATGPRIIRLVNPAVEGCQDGIVVDAGRLVRLIHPHAAVNSRYGYALNGGDDVELQGGDTNSNGQHGCYVAGGTGLGVVGLHALTNGTAASNTYDGIAVGPNVTHLRVLDCVSGNYLYSPAVQRYGISAAAAGSSDYLRIRNNDVKAMGNLTAGEGNFSTGTHNLWDNF